MITLSNNMSHPHLRTVRSRASAPPDNMNYMMKNTTTPTKHWGRTGNFYVACCSALVISYSAGDFQGYHIGTKEERRSKQGVYVLTRRPGPYTGDV